MILVSFTQQILGIIFAVLLVFLTDSCSEYTTAHSDFSPDSTTVYFFPVVDLNNKSTTDVKIINAENIVSVYLVLRYDARLIHINNVDLIHVNNHLFLHDDLSDSANLFISDILVNNDTGRVILGVLYHSNGYQGANGMGAVAKLSIEAVAEFESTKIEISQAMIFAYPLTDPPIPQTNVARRAGLVRHE